MFSFDWDSVLDELQFLLKNPGVHLNNVSELTLDTLYGSMYGLNYRYTPINSAFEKYRYELLLYSINRIKVLVNDFPEATGIRLPIPRCSVGYGTYGWKYSKKIIEYAINNASLIDTAAGYGYGRVELELGKYLGGGVPVPPVYTKIRRDQMSPMAINNAAVRSVEKLQLRNIVMQMHYPNNKYPDAIIDLAKLRQRGIISGLGLSNVSLDMLVYYQGILSNFSGDVITSVQLPFNLKNTRVKDLILKYCQRQGILFIAYSPFGQNFKEIQTPFLQSMAKKYGATPAQIALAFLLHFRGVIPIPNTNDIEHLRQNFLSNDLILSEADVCALLDFYENSKIK